VFRHFLHFVRSHVLFAAVSPVLYGAAVLSSMLLGNGHEKTVRRAGSIMGAVDPPVRIAPRPAPIVTAPPKPAPPPPPPAPSPLDGTRFAGNAQLQSVLDGATLGQGASGPGVVAVEQALAAMGFMDGPFVSDSYGPRASTGVANFQIHAAERLHESLPATGVLDAKTLEALVALAPRAGQTGEQDLPAAVPTYDGVPVRAVAVLNEHRTFLFDAQGNVTGIFINASGAPSSPTQPALRTVVQKFDGPQTAELGVEQYGSAATFGPRLIDFGVAQAFHGDPEPWTLGTNASLGCVRFDNNDIVTVYDALNVGDHVAIVSSLDDPNLRWAPGLEAPPPSSTPGMASKL